MDAALTIGRVEDLTCPRCQTPLEPDDVNVDLMVAMCRGCRATVELIATPTRPPDAMMKLATPPPGITVRESGEQLILTRRWFELGPAFLFMVLWCVVWDGFLVVWYAIGFASVLAGGGEAVMMLLFPLLHVAVGVAVTYSVVATIINRSTLEVGTSHVKVSHGPLPWRSPAPIPTRSIDQLYVVQRIQKNNRGFTLVARRRDRTSVELLRGLTRDVQARFLEQRIEAHLGLADVPVSGEYTG